MALWLQWTLGCATCLVLGMVLGWRIVWMARRGARSHG
jgi:uncharacterized protein YneF (UPF0154 family)